jgi:glyoxylase-like metal-dependent hydrolase (beta-lactamase superfamily II)
MRIGSYEIRLVDAGRFRLDGGAMFGVVPKVLWERKSPADENNRIQMATNCLLLSGDNKNILIDTGIGYKSDEKFAKIFAIDYSEFDINRSLQDLGITHDDITDVILTHLHFDHTGGATKINDRGQVVPTFPKAKYYVQKSQLDWAKNPLEKDRASFLRENFQPLEEADQLVVLEKTGELFPGIGLILVDGHTRAQQLVLIHGDERTMLFAGDLVPTASHLPIPWVMGYDNEPIKTIQEKKEILGRAIQENWLLFFEHDPDIRCVRVKEGERGYEVDEVIEFAYE